MARTSKHDPVPAGVDILARRAKCPSPRNVKPRTGPKKPLPEAFKARLFGPDNPPTGRRPHKQTFTRVFDRILGEGLTPGERDKFTKRFGSPKGFDRLDVASKMELICRIMVDRVLFGGSLEAFREVADRVDPKPRRVELTGRDGTPVLTRALTADVPEAEAAALYRALVEGADPAATDDPTLQ